MFSLHKHLLNSPLTFPFSHSSPKCRFEYQRAETPTRYHCYCGKVEDPPLDPWLVPHSCGQVCERDFKPPCGHRCLLLCHPGMSFYCLEWHMTSLTNVLRATYSKLQTFANCNQLKMCHRWDNAPLAQPRCAPPHHTPQLPELLHLATYWTQGRAGEPQSVLLFLPSASCRNLRPPLLVAPSGCLWMFESCSIQEAFKFLNIFTCHEH